MYLIPNIMYLMIKETAENELTYLVSHVSFLQ